ncbi:hypothetical protein BW38_03522 [Stenotrophomonas sp. RIT309]|uniref:hypothetical protein n=1 Tax=Stenotrophomonas sp. RIT309 TaxID=1470590 RepID=UPI0004476644|nr:hypothetical protein [Stenotrophomonas sp. RIT309]EZP43175.1 hypothetical protein BW38_03522 [Stenotrophomonas sp. RIT309]
MVETVLGMSDLQIKLFTAIGQILVAAAVGIIALRQWLTARNKLKADLFDRRYKLYVDLGQSLQRIVEGDSSAVVQMRRLLAEARWLFGEKTAERLRKEVGNPFQMLAEAKDAAWSRTAGSDQSKLAQEHLDAMVPASQAALVLPKIVAPHLSLKH